MHEYSLMERILETVLENLKGQGLSSSERVREVSLRLGALEIHSEESFRQAFAVLAKGGPLEGARLNLTIEPARFECPCGYRGPSLGDGADIHDAMPAAPCPGCGALCLLKGGRGVDGVSVTVQDEGKGPG
jgi:Zn finger protein HypA/HybF involved in hydrogenase expression